jgi:hypothetical protein
MPRRLKQAITATVFGIACISAAAEETDSANIEQSSKIGIICPQPDYPYLAGVKHCTGRGRT